MVSLTFHFFKSLYYFSTKFIKSVVFHLPRRPRLEMASIQARGKKDNPICEAVEDNRKVEIHHKKTRH